MESPAELPILDQSRTQEREQEQEQHPNGLMPVDTEKSTGFDASPYAERGEDLSPRPTRVLDPRSPLTRLTSSTTAKRNFSNSLAPKKTGPNALVDFEGPDDPYRPLNWPSRKKFVTVLLYGLTTMCSSWATSIFSSDTRAIGEEYYVSNIVSTLGTTLFLFGFGLGPLLWAPLSEIYGRRLAVFPPYFIGACFSFATAASKDLSSVMITRFFTGFFASAPVSNTGGVLGDIYSPAQRAVALAGYAMAVAGGPLIAPIVAGAMLVSGVSWRWTEYMTGIMMLAILLVDVIVLDETYPSALLVYKARQLRYETGDWALHAKHEEWNVTFSSLATKYLIRPFQILATPIGFFMATYAAFVYGILYLCFAAFPIEFEEVRGWNQLIGSLPFLATLIGTVLGAGANVYNTKFYVKKLEANNMRPVPEARLPPMMVGGILFAVGLFLFGWTSSKHVHWIGPCIGAVLLGAGFLMIFQASLNYVIDTFQRCAASAVAAVTALRCIFAGVFPIFAAPMFHNLGVDWASTLIALLAVVMIPIPFIFYFYGLRIRARGKFSKASTI